MHRHLVVLTFVFLVITAGARLVTSQDSSAEASGDIRTVTLATSRGDIKVILPDDISAGDTISEL